MLLVHSAASLQTINRSTANLLSILAWPPVQCGNPTWLKQEGKLARSLSLSLARSLSASLCRSLASKKLQIHKRLTTLRLLNTLEELIPRFLPPSEIQPFDRIIPSKLSFLGLTFASFCSLCLLVQFRTKRFSCV